ncbi:MAG: hypothetical protein LBF68_05215 [Christensenellaceae bacterium]|nr:hypothetical protein [Christensenellaceae bacterium]
MPNKETYCSVCYKTKLSKNEIAVCKKILGRKIVNFFCMECFADYLELTVEELEMKIEDFKNQGCQLFK